MLPDSEGYKMYAPENLEVVQAFLLKIFNECSILQKYETQQNAKMSVATHRKHFPPPQ